MLVAPVIYFAVAWGIAGKKDRYSVGPPFSYSNILACAHAVRAVAPSGDYGYSFLNLPFNLVGNTVGYFVATIAGPKAVESWSLLREYLKLHKMYAAAGEQQSLLFLDISSGQCEEVLVNIRRSQRGESLLCSPLRHTLVWEP